VDLCVQNLPIPGLIKNYNEKKKPDGIGPDACIGCRSCESVCPQGIQISDVMNSYTQLLKEGN